MGFCLTTERLRLEDMTRQDLAGIRQVASNPEVMKYVLIWLENDEQVTAFHRHAMEGSEREDRMDYILTVRVPGSGAFAGIAFIEIDPDQASTAEVGCVLLPAYWKCGYASEILQALLAFGFGPLGLHRVYGKCDELNIPSARSLEKGGMNYEGTLREHVWLRDHWRSTRYYGMLAGEFTASRVKQGLPDRSPS